MEKAEHAQSKSNTFWSPDNRNSSNSSNKSSKNSPSLDAKRFTSNYRIRMYSRSRSLSNISVDSYTTGEIRRIRERLLRTNSQFERSIIRKFTSSQKMTLLCLTLVDFMCFCSMSIMAPFFPREAAEKGLSDAMSGFVFSFYALVMFLTSPFFGQYLPYIGPKCCFLSGILIAGICNVLFGLLEYVWDYTVFTSLCFIIRGFEALGASAFSTASYVFVVKTFPDNIGSVLGILETFVGLGMSVGPAIGGLLYSLGGFQMPFYVLGIAMIVIIPVNMCLLPNVGDFVVGGKGESIFRLIKVPAVVITGLVVIVVSSVWAFLDPTLEPHLRQFNLSSEKIGLIFLLFSSLYGIFSPIWGCCADRIKNNFMMMVWGLLLCTVFLLMLGPCPFIPSIPNVIWINLVALSGLGIAVALALLPTFQGVLKSAVEGGCRDTLATYSLVAGVWSCMLSLGEVIGPSVGGILLQYYGFPIASTVMAGMTFFTAVITFCFFCTRSVCRSNSSDNSESIISDSWKSDSDESTSLLSSLTSSHILYVEEKMQHYERSRKNDYEFGDINPNQVTDVRGTLFVTSKGSCEA